MTKNKILIITDDFIHNSQKSGSILIKDLAIAINNTKYFSSIVLAPDINSEKIRKVNLVGIETILFPSGIRSSIVSVMRSYFGVPLAGSLDLNIILISSVSKLWSG